MPVPVYRTSTLLRIAMLASLGLAAMLAACAAPDDEASDTPNSNLTGSADPSVPGGPLPGGTDADEQFPAVLNTAYTGPAIESYTNAFGTYRQLVARVKYVFADEKIGGDTAAYLASKIALLQGADFVTRFSEGREASTDFLLAVDGIAKDACERAATNKTGPFAGANPETVGAGVEDALVTQLYRKALFRSPTAQESADSKKLVADLIAVAPSKTSAWAGLCEALMRHQDSLFTLPPSFATASTEDKPRLRLTKFSNDLAGRPPTEAEIAAYSSKTASELVDYFATLPEFRETLFHRLRLQTESRGTPESDEPARLWTYIAMNGLPFAEIFRASYSVDAAFKKVERPPVHGATGILTMKGFIKGKPSLPHYNYSARVLLDFMGVKFTTAAADAEVRLNASVASTVTKGGLCYGCHSLLTPLAYQRQKWTDDGNYRETDEKGAPIDDSDHGVVEEYRFKGKGMAGFSEAAVRKEGFVRTTLQTHVSMLLGRPMRYSDDERTLYRSLWVTTFKENGNLLAIIKQVVSHPSYLNASSSGAPQEGRL
jgi:hypothetical protein